MIASADSPRETPSFYDAARLAPPAESAQACAEFERSLVGGTRSFLDLAREVLADPHVDAQVWSGLAAAVSRARSPELRGVIGLVLILHALDDLVRQESASSQPIPLEQRILSRLDVSIAPGFKRDRGLLTRHEIQAALRGFYVIPSHYELEGATLHEVGTTSFIVSCRAASTPHDPFAARPKLALKCLLPRYLAVRSIAERTARYKSDHDVEGPYAPRIYDSTETYIAMDFMNGQTLARWYADNVVAKPGGELDVTAFRIVGLALCAILAELHATGRHHLDLSPTNVIVDKNASERLTFTLIDFGHNFVVTEKVSSNAAFQRAARYVAPELFDDPARDDLRCDLYALGTILLEATGASRLAEDDKDPGDPLSALWERAPGIARIIEDLVDDDPANRLLLASPADLDEPYRYVRSLIEHETDLVATFQAQTGSAALGVVRGFDLMSRVRKPHVVELLEAARLKTSDKGGYQDTARLIKWAQVTNWLWAFSAVAFIALTLGDVLPAGLTGPWKSYRDVLDAPFQVGDFWDNLAGRAVALTSAITAVTYYMNIYATLAPRRVRASAGRLADLVARPIVPIGHWTGVLVIMLYSPDAWAISAGLATAPAVLNNYLHLRLAREARDEGKCFSFDRSSTRYFLSNFAEWWRLLAYYGGTVVIIGCCLAAGLVEDAWFYAVIVCFINVQKMYRLNCTRLAPAVRGNLSRAICTLQRAASRADASTHGTPTTERSVALEGLSQ